ncbi:cysteine--tRNA ligase [Aliarcobacter butzleri]|uniref:cysteine--tRNA ligase n=1 Tax=Aliarcobacter butzleri TaxID=28197 RepID=UPI00263D6937|nr:cysteine--tRNA ligase [Aliarcobacter butzleri]MDN5100889.1 cysteine--tRNA ligase [Aliarcobacter butzleri]
MNTLHIFDSVKKEKVEFKPIQEGKVKIYVCGPTVYDDSHLGHARSAIAFDLLHRVLKANDYEVTMTKNFTDIDDKIIKKMYETNKTLEDITNQYINAYKADMKALNILDNTIEPKATENLEVMKEMISNLISKDIAYKTSDSVYFDTSKDNLYGTLSHKSNDENSQARVEENQEKRNSADFALWKFEKANDVSFDAPFGKGRPGWHIECSAMIEKHLAYKNSQYQIDIHAGGADLLFPHHENEAAQTRCSSGQNLAKYWMHNGFVNINGEKMSKSLGNSFFLKDVLKSYSGEVIRFYLMSTHYRADLSFNEEDLIASKKRLDKIYRLKKMVYGSKMDDKPNQQLKIELLNALNDDLNTSKAFAIIDEWITGSYNVLENNPNINQKIWKKNIISNINFIEEVLGIGGNDAYAYFQFGIDESTKEKIEDLILKRNEAKKAKDFQTADKLRDELSAMDISLMDTVNGTVWEKL